ncbi:hypothetical protein Dimus_021964 [Dionaea muscipula]
MEGVLVIFVMGLIMAGMISCDDAKPQVPCYFIFGDSLSDNGNNNGFKVAAKVNYSPYGIDFPGRIPTGRFSNGRIVPDIIAELLGFKGYIPSYKEALRSDVSKGVNYASGGSGIHQETGKNLGSRISLDLQVQNHNVVVSKLLFARGIRSAAGLLNKCLYTINIGSNDYINNYFMPEEGYSSSRYHTTDEFATILIDEYSKQIKILYKHGARKVALFGLGPIGCSPGVIAHVGLTNGSGCVDVVADAVDNFNHKLRSLVEKLNVEFPDSKFTYINTAGMQLSDSQGFKVINATCCKEVRKDGLCVDSSTPCANRSEYVFWDYFHPTEAVNAFIGRRTYQSQQSSDAYPIDISHLAKLQLSN